MPLRRTRGQRNADGTMPLMEHLYELRRRIVFAFLGLLGGSIVGFVWYRYGIGAIGLKSLGDILVKPYCEINSPPRVELIPHSCTLLATGPFSAIEIRFKSAILAGVVLGAPVWLWQLWGFVTPALFTKERRFALTFVITGACLFAAGAVLAYYVISKGLQVLVAIGGPNISSAFDPSTYFSFLIAMLIIFGVSFELPLLLIMLNRIGLVKGVKLAKARRYSIFGLVVFAALVVPGNDPLTMSALAVSLTILYEVAVQVSKYHDRAKGRRNAEEGFGDLSDDEASPTPAAGVSLGVPGGGEQPTPTPAAGPINDPFGDAT